MCLDIYVCDCVADMEMPVGFQYTDSKLQSALKEGTISMDAIDASVTRILTAMYSIGMFDEANRFDAVASPESNVTSVQHNYLSREVAAKSTVLLKNENGVLPMLLEEVACYYKCIAVIGDNSTVSGMGSGHVTPAYVITQQDGIEAMLHQQSRTVTAQVTLTLTVFTYCKLRFHWFVELIHSIISLHFI